jgi:hypothetical protein
MPEYHPSVIHLLGLFGYEHLPPRLAAHSKLYHDLAYTIAEECTGPEATVALRKLLEAKDAGVRSFLASTFKPPEG